MFVNMYAFGVFPNYCTPHEGGLVSEKQFYLSFSGLLLIQQATLLSTLVDFGMDVSLL